MDFSTKHGVGRRGEVSAIGKPSQHLNRHGQDVRATPVKTPESRLSPAPGSWQSTWWTAEWACAPTKSPHHGGQRVTWMCKLCSAPRAGRTPPQARCHLRTSGPRAALLHNLGQHCSRGALCAQTQNDTREGAENVTMIFQVWQCSLFDVQINESPCSTTAAGCRNIK